MISLIIPTYNERENIGRIVKSISRVATENKLNIEIIVVDDNSKDGTAEIVRGLMKNYNVKLMERPKKMGLASAVLDGLRLAKGNIIGVMDADFSHPPEKIPELVNALKENDIAIGSRFAKGGKLVGRTKIRHVITAAAILIAKSVLGLKVNDPVSGFFLLKRKMIERERIKAKGFKILLSILTNNKGKKVIEIPITYLERRKGKSKFGFNEIINFMITVLRLRLD